MGGKKKLLTHCLHNHNCFVEAVMNLSRGERYVGDRVAKWKFILLILFQYYSTFNVKKRLENKFVPFIYFALINKNFLSLFHFISFMKRIWCLFNLSLLILNQKRWESVSIIVKFVIIEIIVNISLKIL